MLEKLKAERQYITQGPWSVSLSNKRKWWLVLANSGTANEQRVAKVNDADDVEFIAKAPKLAAAVEAVLTVHRHADGQYKDLQDQAWSGEHCAHCRVEWPCHTAEVIKEALR